MNSRKESSNTFLSLKDLISKNFIDGFIQHRQVQEKQQTYYRNQVIDFYLFHGKGLDEFTFQDCQAYLAYLQRVHLYHQISSNVLRKKIKIVTSYLNYLQNHYVDMKDVVWKWNDTVQQMENNKDKKPEKISNKKVQKKEKTLPDIIQDFLRYLNDKEYRGKGYKKNIRIFNRFLEKEGIDINVFFEGKMEKLLFNKIRIYEERLSERVTNEEIANSTASIYLRVVQLFVKYLSSKGIVNQKYSIPIHLRGRPNRANEYVPKESIIKLMEMIYEHSNHILRDLAIFLIIVDSGCRSIELCNLTMKDYDRIAKTLSFQCDKTPRRKVKISQEVIDVINDYMKIRDSYHPKSDNLFCNYSGFSISSELVNVLFYNWNMKAFGESRYPPKSFRHTYITNALEEYGFERVSSVVGHKEWRSTYYYLYRSKKRLLANTLDKSPLMENKGVSFGANQNSNKH